MEQNKDVGGMMERGFEEGTEEFSDHSHGDGL